MCFSGESRLQPVWGNTVPGCSRFAVISVAALLLSVMSGCISLPPEVKHELAAPQPGEPDNYRKAEQPVSGPAEHP